MKTSCALRAPASTECTDMSNLPASSLNGDENALAALANLTGSILRIDSAQDHQIAQRVHMSLRATGRQPLKSVEVAVQEGRVTLQGRLPSYYMKQLAQHTVLGVAGVTGVESRLRVES